MQDPSNSVEFQAQARNMQEHFDLLHQAIVSVRTSMSASRVNSSNSMDMQSRFIIDQPPLCRCLQHHHAMLQVFLDRRLGAHAHQLHMVRFCTCL
jgi:hypothetical protein